MTVGTLDDRAVDSGPAAAPRDPVVGTMVIVVLAISTVILLLTATVLWLGFRSGAAGDADAGYTLANYRDAFGDAYTYKVLANTIGFAAVTLLVALAIGLPTAWLAERTDLARKPLLYAAMTAGLLIPGFAEAMGWLFLLHPRIGLLNGWLVETFGLAGPPLDITTIAGMGWVQGLNLAPVAFIMTASVFRAMDPTLEESAAMSGAGTARIAWRVTLPLAWPGILAAAIYIFMIGFGAFDVPAIIGWSNRVFTFSTYLLVELSPQTGLPQYGIAAALSTFVICLAGGLSFFYARLQRRAFRYQVVTGKAYRPRLVQLGRRQWMAWSGIGAYLFLSKLIPLLVLIWAALVPYFQLPSVAAFATLSFDQFRALNWDLLTEGLANTGLLMVLTPTITLAACLCFSWIVLRTRIRFRAVFDLIAFLPHAIPHIVFGVAALLLGLYVTQGLIPLFGNLWVLLLVFVVARVSYGTRMTNSALIQIHKDLEDSAAMSGAAMRSVVTNIILPLVAPTLIAAWLWIALLTFRELTLAVLLTGRDNITLPVIVWGMWLNGASGQAAALTLVLLLLLLPLIGLYWWFAKRRDAGAV